MEQPPHEDREGREDGDDIGDELGARQGEKEKDNGEPEKQEKFFPPFFSEGTERRRDCGPQGSWQQAGPGEESEQQDGDKEPGGFVAPVHLCRVPEKMFLDKEKIEEIAVHQADRDEPGQGKGGEKNDAGKIEGGPDNVPPPGEDHVPENDPAGEDDADQALGKEGEGRSRVEKQVEPPVFFQPEPEPRHGNRDEEREGHVGDVDLGNGEINEACGQDAR
ncbi:hypothetical protein SDC9_41451 [bioreactor metagenome]|uniref:Uncharacterized protein n=1 Tax=bioreactor metagenome TaxID=1076179 RepID=A0A644VV56_9ZZZZ